MSENKSHHIVAYGCDLHNQLESKMHVIILFDLPMTMMCPHYSYWSSPTSIFALNVPMWEE